MAVALSLSVDPSPPPVEPAPAAAQLAPLTDESLSAAMRENGRQTQGWFWSWGALLAAMSATQLALAVAAPADQKGPWALGAGLYGAGVLVHLAFAPFSPVFGPADGAARADLEGALAKQAWVARFTRSWAAHLIGIGSGVAMGAIAWLEMGRPLDAVFLLVTAVAVTELKMWTLPTGVIELHDRVRVSLAVSGSGGAVRVQW
ncbi:MAG: hypothetical protein JNK82_21715 [Myxococcaceae bacterium]|nr:hypothetical protein [Myxococcaceae bacterium]